MKSAVKYFQLTHDKSLNKFDKSGNKIFINFYSAEMIHDESLFSSGSCELVTVSHEQSIVALASAQSNRPF